MKKTIVFVVALLLVVGAVYAKDIYNDGVLIVDADNVYPATDSATELGESGYEWEALFVDSITLGGVAKTSWGSVVSPWEDSGTTTILTSAPTKFILTHSTGDIQTTRMTADDFYGTTNGQNIDLSTNNALKFIDNSDTLTITASGNDFTVDSSDGGIIFALTDATDGTVDLQTNNDTDDYIQVSTTTNQPLINFVGCNGKITAASGTIDFDNEAITTTGTLGAGAITGTSFIVGDDTIDVVVDDQLRFASNDEESTIEAYGFEAKDGVLQLTADEGDDAGDKIQLVSDQATNSLLITSDVSVKDTHATIFTLANSGIVTTTGDVIVEGTTPKVEIGDGGTEDNTLLYDGNEIDFYIALDDSDNEIAFGTGATVGAGEALTIASDRTVTVPYNLDVTTDFNVDGNVTFGNASTDTVTLTSRLIVRTIATTASTACTTGEVVFCSADNTFYGATSSTAGSFVAFN